MWAQPQKTKKGGTQGDNSESAVFGFGLDNFAVFAGNPADLRVDDNGMPAVFGGRNPFIGRAVFNRSNAAVLGVIAYTDIDGAAAAYNAHLLDRGLFRFGRLDLRFSIRFAFIIIGDGIHQRSMRFTAIDAVLLDADLPLECLEGSLRFRAKFAVIAVLGQAVFQLQKELLQGLHIGALAAVFQRAGAKRVLSCSGVWLCIGTACKGGVTIIHEGKLEPMRPFAGGYLGFHAAVAETTLLDSIAVTDIHADMAVRSQRNARDLRQRINRTPGTALARGIGEHAVGRFVGAAIAAVLAGEGLVGADRFGNAGAAARPVVSLDETNAVGTDLLLGNIILIAGSTAVLVMGRILLCLAAAQGFGALVDYRAVPIGLAQHGQIESDKVFTGIISPSEVSF